jgi:hypothetical protein
MSYDFYMLKKELLRDKEITPDRTSQILRAIQQEEEKGRKKDIQFQAQKMAIELSDQIDDLKEAIKSIQAFWTLARVLAILAPLATTLAIVFGAGFGSDTLGAVFGTLAGFFGLGAFSLLFVVFGHDFRLARWVGDGLFNARRELKSLERKHTRLILAREGIDTTIV